MVSIVTENLWLTNKSGEIGKIYLETYTFQSIYTPPLLQTCFKYRFLKVFKFLY